MTSSPARKDYQTYSGSIFGNSTNNGGEYAGRATRPTRPTRPLPSVPVKSANNGFVGPLWNLNHEFTHCLDGRYDMKGDFSAGITVPDIWWIEGLAEYVSYSYRGVTDTEAVTEAGEHTYTLSTLWQSTYDNSDETRTYPWGYLAVRYMVEKHPADIYAMLAKFRTGDYTGGYAVYSSIGTALRRRLQHLARRLRGRRLWCHERRPGRGLRRHRLGPVGEPDRQVDRRRQHHHRPCVGLRRRYDLHGHQPVEDLPRPPARTRSP